jgi:hypothetical protein
LIFAVRPDGADHQWRRVPPRELSIALVADEHAKTAAVPHTIIFLEIT